MGGTAVRGGTERQFPAGNAPARPAATAAAYRWRIPAARKPSRCAADQRPRTHGFPTAGRPRPAPGHGSATSREPGFHATRSAGVRRIPDCRATRLLRARSTTGLLGFHAAHSAGLPWTCTAGVRWIPDFWTTGVPRAETGHPARLPGFYAARTAGVLRVTIRRPPWVPRVDADCSTRIPRPATGCSAGFRIRAARTTGITRVRAVRPAGDSWVHATRAAGVCRVRTARVRRAGSCRADRTPHSSSRPAAVAVQPAAVAGAAEPERRGAADRRGTAVPAMARNRSPAAATAG